MSALDGSVTMQLKGKIEGIKRSMNRVTHEAVAMVVMQLDALSPVGMPETWKDQAKAFRMIMMGYKPGQFRGNWQLGVDQRPASWLPGNIDPTGARTVQKNLEAIPSAASRVNRYYITNLAPYAHRLEDGWSAQCPPGGMVQTVRGEFRQTLQQIVDQIKSEGGRVR
jgi:hypothetical protein